MLALFIIPFPVYGLFCLQKETHKMGVKQFCHFCYLLLMAFPKSISIFSSSSLSDVLKYILCTFGIFIKMSNPSPSGFRPSSVFLRILPTLVWQSLRLCHCFNLFLILLEWEFLREVLVKTMISIVGSAFQSLRLWLSKNCYSVFHKSMAWIWLELMFSALSFTKARLA